MANPRHDSNHIPRLLGTQTIRAAQGDEEARDLARSDCQATIRESILALAQAECTKPLDMYDALWYSNGKGLSPRPWNRGPVSCAGQCTSCEPPSSSMAGLRETLSHKLGAQRDATQG